MSDFISNNFVIFVYSFCNTHIHPHIYIHTHTYIQHTHTHIHRHMHTRTYVHTYSGNLNNNKKNCGVSWNSDNIQHMSLIKRIEKHWNISSYWVVYFLLQSIYNRIFQMHKPNNIAVKVTEKIYINVTKVMNSYWSHTKCYLLDSRLYLQCIMRLFHIIKGSFTRSLLDQMDFITVYTQYKMQLFWYSFLCYQHCFKLIKIFHKPRKWIEWNNIVQN